MSAKNPNRYQALVASLFHERYKKGAKVLPFTREQLVAKAGELKVPMPKNPGDVIYSFRYRNPLPASILDTEPKGMEWIIEGTGRAKYEFRLVKMNRIEPNPNLVTIKIPDATPEIVTANAMSDEQALLAKVRYNRLIDVFLGLAACSLQNHLRTTVAGLGQIEIDEIYVGIDRHGCQYVVPVQAKSGTDRLASVQTKQDIACCAEKFPNLVCRSVSAQFMNDDRIAMFELCLDENGLVKLVEERHYKLVSAEEISTDELVKYRLRTI